MIWDGNATRTTTLYKSNHVYQSWVVLAIVLFNWNLVVYNIVSYIQFVFPEADSSLRFPQLFSGIHDVWKTLRRTRNIVYFFHQVNCFTVNLILPSIDFRDVVSYCYHVERWTRNFKRPPVRKLWIIIRLVSHAAVLRGALRDDPKNGCIGHHYSTKSIVIRRPKLSSSSFLLATKWLRYPIKRAKITTCFLRPCL